MMNNDPIQYLQFDDENELTPTQEANGPVTVLGRTFVNDEARREYFRSELRNKLPELRKIEGFPIGEDDDIIALSDPPYYTACPNPWLNDFISEWENNKSQMIGDGKRDGDFFAQTPYASDVSEGKYNPLYLLHPYLTKVPYPAIVKFLEHYTRPGDITLDGFAGTGMSGVAARLCPTGARNSICIDLSPLATFISYFVNSTTSNRDFEYNVNNVITKVLEELGWMFKTKHNDRTEGIINYVIWSNVYICPNCGEELTFYDVAFNAQTGDVSSKFKCEKCGSILSKESCSTLTETTHDNVVNDLVVTPKRIPVSIGYTCNNRRYQKRPDKHDLEVLEQIQNFQIPYWVPDDGIIDGDEIGRARRDGIKYFEQYYTKRNLAVLSKIKDLIPSPLYNALITKVAFQSTIMYRYCTKGGGPMSGTMYVPALIKEVNILNQLKAFINDRKKVDVASNPDNVLISTQSSSSLSLVPDNSIDYIFTDPPFGHNFMYSELNYISEMWLKVKTNNELECIESKFQNKGVSDYQHIIQSVFSEYYRVLKAGKWLSVEFSNTSASVWNAIVYALINAGFVIANVSALDKKKESYKAVTTTTAVKQDLIISCFKPSDGLLEKFNILDINPNEHNVYESIHSFIEEMLNRLVPPTCRNNSTTAVVERNPKILYDRLIAFFVQRGQPIPMDAGKFQRFLRDSFVERDGMFFTAEQALQYDELRRENPGTVTLALFVGSESEGIQWLKRELLDNPQTYQDIQPKWIKDLVSPKKGDSIPELLDILKENFLQDDEGRWYIPDAENEADLERVRQQRLLREFKGYADETAQRARVKIKEARLEALRAGFKNCYQNKDFETIVRVGDRIPQTLLTEDEILLQYYDIASSRI